MLILTQDYRCGGNKMDTERKSKSSTMAKRRYNNAHYDKLYPQVKKGKKLYYLEAAEVGGYASLNDFLESTLDAKAAEILGRLFDDNK